MEDATTLPEDDSQQAREALLLLENQCRYMLHLALSTVTPLRNRETVESITCVGEMMAAVSTLNTGITDYLTRLNILAEKRIALDAHPITIDILTQWVNIGYDYDTWLSDFNQHVLPSVNTIQSLLPNTESVK